jgi:hypothetical protein
MHINTCEIDGTVGYDIYVVYDSLLWTVKIGSVGTYSYRSMADYWRLGVWYAM